MAELHRQDHEDGAERHVRPYTLPLFDPPLGPPRAPGLRRRRMLSSPRELALHIYWSAGLEGHALGSLAAETTNRDEQTVLRELQRLEYEVKETAASLLSEVWQVKLPGGGSDEDGGAELAA